MRFLDDLLAIGGATVVLLVTIVLLPESPIRVALGLPFVLFFPGYTLVAALYPRKDGIDGVERLALSLGLSLAVVPLIGLMLNYLPWGIRLTPIIVGLTLFALICSGLAARNRLLLSSSERFRADVRPLVLGLRRLPWPTLLVSAAVIAMVLVLGFRSGLLGGSRVGEPFTEFYVLGPGGKAEDYPKDLLPGQQVDVILGVVNHEGREQTYSVDIRAQGASIKTIGPVSLANEQKWVSKTSFTVTQPGDRVKVDFLLLTPDATLPYRALHLWVRVRSSQ